MQVFVIVGQRGCGKSTLAEERAKAFLKNNPKEKFFPYDIEKRYFPDRPLPPIKEFMSKVITEENSLFVFEESTIFFPNRGRDKDLIQAMVTSRYNGNLMFLIYHALGEVPKYVFRLADCVILFRTKEDEAEILSDKKTKRFHPAWSKIIYYPQKCNQFKLKNGEYSPYLIIKL